jgi:hypothetical protein
VSPKAASIWRACDGSRRIKRLSLRAVRAVEGQHRVSTRKLVDSDDEQRVLEELIDRGKPRLPRLAGVERLHYLLSTSFRYPPLRHGSRFGSRAELGIWYGSRTHRTVFAEVAYYRLVFLEGTLANLDRLMVELTAFDVSIAARRGVDLTRAPFAEHEAQISSKHSYTTSQRLGHEMREAGVQAFVFRSARDAQGGSNIGLFDPAAFAKTAPEKLETWLCVAEKRGVEVSRKDFFRRESFSYPRSDFEIRGKLPMPAT